MAATVDSVRQAIAEFDRTAGVRFATLDELAADSLQRERLMANLSSVFGAIAIVLAAVGVYGVVAYAAASRRREIGIRLALGARGADVLRALLGRVALVIVVGLVLGLALAIPRERGRRLAALWNRPSRAVGDRADRRHHGRFGSARGIGPCAPRDACTDPVAALRAE